MPFRAREGLKIAEAVSKQDINELIKLFTEHGEKSELLKGNSPFYIVCAEGHVRAAKVLIEGGKIEIKTINEKNKNGMSPLEIATKNDHTAMVEYLKKVLQQEEQLKKDRREIESLNALIAKKRQEIKSLERERDRGAIDLMEKMTQEIFTKIENSIEA